MGQLVRGTNRFTKLYFTTSRWPTKERGVLADAHLFVVVVLRVVSPRASRWLRQLCGTQLDLAAVHPQRLQRGVQQEANGGGAHSRLPRQPRPRLVESASSRPRLATASGSALLSRLRCAGGPLSLRELVEQGRSEGPSLDLLGSAPARTEQAEGGRDSEVNSCYSKTPADTAHRVATEVLDGGRMRKEIFARCQKRNIYLQIYTAIRTRKQSHDHGHSMSKFTHHSLS